MTVPKRHVVAPPPCLAPLTRCRPDSHTQLAAALAREKDLRKQLTAAQRQISQHRLEMTGVQNVAKSQVEGLSSQLQKTKSQLDAAVDTLQSLRDRFALVRGPTVDGPGGGHGCLRALPLLTLVLPHA